MTDTQPSIRARVARRLRFAADRIDPAGAPKCMSGWSFTFEEGEGIVFRDDGHGCPLWYHGDTAYDRAHDEAGTVTREHAWRIAR